MLTRIILVELDALNFNLFSVGFLSDGCILLIITKNHERNWLEDGNGVWRGAVAGQGDATGVAAILRRDVT